MIPTSGILNTNLQEVKLPSATYAIAYTSDADRVLGYVDGLRAVQQAVYLILNTERYEFPIYSWGYGVELQDLYGKPTTYVTPELERRIREALLADNRIISVNKFEFTRNKGKIHVTFVVNTIFGSFDNNLEVSV